MVTASNEIQHMPSLQSNIAVSVDTQRNA